MADAEKFRPLLDSELADVRATVAALRADMDSVSDSRRGSNVDDEHDPEGATIAFELAQASSLVRDADHRMSEIELALTKLDRGTYGLCEVCGEPIAEGRLEARPWTRYCILHTGG